VVKHYAADGLKLMLHAVWKGYDCLVASFLPKVDIKNAEEEIERSITMVLERCIDTQLSGLEPFYVQHGPYENETRAPAPAQPPQYDIAFVLNSNRRVMWPMEAKVMHMPKDVALYVKAIIAEFLTGRYAPFSRSAAMIGYLLSGPAEDAIPRIEKKLGEKLHTYPQCNPPYSHHISEHFRELRNPNHAGGPFQCHHMIMPMSNLQVRNT
jgi:hypothetical protein